MADPRDRALEVGLVALTLLLRAVEPHQPILENYVGRQVPTAMVARNLDRGSGFLRPQLDTLPAPNLFLVEPPIYAAAVVGLRRLLGLDLVPAGRLTSAIGLTLAAWGLYGLVRRRHGTPTAALATFAFAIAPLTIRYGRAFQPDALMLGAGVGALRCWDAFAASRRAGWAIAGGLLLAVGLALKITSAYLLVPLGLVLLRGVPIRSRLWLLLALVPALLWYAHAARLLMEGGGSRASADNSAIWLRSIGGGLGPLLDLLGHGARYLAIRGFTPVGFLLACWGLGRVREGRDLWVAWGLAALAMLGGLAAKAHHEYYWLAVAPVMAVGVGLGWRDLARRSRLVGLLAGCLLVAGSFVQARPTFRTPAEWSAIPRAAGLIEGLVPRDGVLVAAEALLFAADRRGCRLEIAQAAQRRAAGEWGGRIGAEDAVELVDFYQQQGARYFADLTGGPIDGRTAALHEAIRGRHEILVDREGLLLARLRTDRERRSGDESHAPR